MNLLVVTMPSRKKLNTYGVESPCERLPGVGSFLANPGLSKEQHLRRCTMKAFILQNTSNGIPPQYLRRCVLATSVISYISMTVSTIALISLGFISPVICANLQPFSPVINTPISVMSFSSPFASTRMSLSASLSLANS